MTNVPKEECIMECFGVISLLLVIAGGLAKTKVEQNRGLVVDKPDWKLVPEMTINAVFFLAGVVIFGCLEFDERIALLVVGEIIVLILLLFAGRCILWKQFPNSWFMKMLKQENPQKKKDDTKEQGDNGTQIDSWKKLEEVSVYLGDTLIYVTKYFLIFTAVGVTVFQMVTDKDAELLEITVLDNLQTQMQVIHMTQYFVIICVAGMMLSMYRIVSLLLIPEERASYNSYERIRRTLESKEVKN